jgi:thiol-disulfide isomerase/thioredoxin
MSPVWSALLGLTVAVVIVQSLFIVGLARQVGGILLRLGPARAGQVEGGPEIGTQTDLAHVEKGRPSVIAFVSPHCEACKDLPPAFKAVLKNYPELQLIAVITGESQAAKNEYATMIGPIARTDLEDLYELWNIDGTPFAVGLDSQGRVLSTGVVNNLEHLEGFAQQVISQALAASHPHSPNGDHDHRAPQDLVLVRQPMDDIEVEAAR